MMCENCGKNPVTTHIKKVVNGISTEKHLCAACAKGYGFSPFKSNTFSGILSSMLGEYNEPKNTKQCACCGSTFNDIVNSGKVGCAACYEKFGEELLPYLKRLHGNVKHIGKVPNASPLAVATVNDRINALRAELNLLIKNEEFEKAATVRDEIRKLESQVNSNDGE
ncbi:MAG: hypothetical protein E7526_04870 [Ruminococcaceae bacterium]|nr:hypothetical protein [Oscillospiraceae bacterium]